MEVNMKTQNTQLITLWDALMEGQKTFVYRDIVEVYICCPKGPKKAKILKATDGGVLVKMPRLKKGNIYGVKIVTSRGWNSFRYLYYQ
jgi:hypothetical protein